MDGLVSSSPLLRCPFPVVLQFECAFCTLIFAKNSDLNAHTLGHFPHKHCDGCNQNLIRVADVWYQAHADDNCAAIKIERSIEIECFDWGLDECDAPLLVDNAALNDVQLLAESDPIEVKAEQESVAATVDEPLHASRATYSTDSDGLKRCSFCALTYTTLSALQRHQRTSHRDRISRGCPFVCDTCGAPFKVERFFIDHLRSRHGINWEPTAKQAINSSTVTAVNETEQQNVAPNRTEHLFVPHISVDEIDDVTLVSVAEVTESDIAQILNSCDVDGAAAMDIDEYAASDTELDSGAQNDAPSDESDADDIRASIRCPSCAAEFPSNTAMNRHRRTEHGHEINSPFTCHVCDLPFKVHNFYVKHLAQKHGILTAPPASDDDAESDALDAAAKADADTLWQWECDKCSAKYKTESSLHRHKRFAHSEDFALRCEVCRLPFRDENCHKLHMFVKHGVGDAAALQGPARKRVTDPLSDRAGVGRNKRRMRRLQLAGCSLCPARYTSASALLRHKRSAHGEELKSEFGLKCGWCHRRFKDKHFFDKHMLVKHGVEEQLIMPCPHCDLQFISYASQLQHQQTMHMDRLTADAHSAVKRDVPAAESHHSEALTVAGQVQPAEDDSTQRRRRQRKVRRRRPFGCNVCSAGFFNQAALSQHQRDQHRRTADLSKPNLYRCPLCPLSYPNKSSLCRHKRLKHGTQRDLFRCFQCDKGFDTDHKLRQHMHDQHKVTATFLPPQFCCYVCGAAYGQTANLINHLKTHPIVDYKCGRNGCDEQFDSLKLLADHFAEHSRTEREQAAMTCNVCNKPYKRFGNHKCERPPQFMCSFCGRMFKCLNALECHTNTHTGHKPFKCTVCAKTFATRTNLAAHAMLHGDKRLVCKADGCDAAFKGYKQLHMHEFNAHNIRRTTHPCTVCERIFPDKVLLRNHLKSHGIVPQA